MATVRELLNRLRWDAESRHTGVVIEVRDRLSGAERVEPIPFAAVAEILPAGVTLTDGVFLPYHRIVGVRRGDDVLWPPGGDGRP